MQLLTKLVRIYSGLCCVIAEMKVFAVLLILLRLKMLLSVV